jgi:Rrf2 family nitric oxide-sensitive transcriptional repressor
MPGLQFSQRIDLALHGLWALVRLEKSRLVLVSEIARTQNVSTSYLAKVFQQLSCAGLITSVRGKRGGYALARPPEAITVGDVVRVMESGQPMYQCQARERCCDAVPDCLLLRLFAKAEQQMYAVLDEVTLADLLADFQHNRERMSWLLSWHPPERSRGVPGTMLPKD